MVFFWSMVKDAGYLSQQNQVSPTGLMLYVDANNPLSYSGVGTTWSDLSGNSNNMLLINCSFTGSSFYFNGTSSVAQTPNLYSLLTTSNASLSQTIEIWFKTNSVGCIVNEQNSYSLPSWYDTVIEAISTTTLKGRYWNLPSPYINLSSSGPFNNGFNYAAIRYNGSAVDGMFNGVFLPSVSLTRTFSPSPAAIYYPLGNGLGTNMGNGNFFTGQVSIYRNYKRACSNSELTNNYLSDKSKYGY